MAAPINTDRAINLLPTPIREKVLEKLISGESTRKVSAFLLQHGHKIHYTSINRYKNEVLPVQLALVDKLQKAHALDDEANSPNQNVASTTNALISANYVDSRLNAKFSRYDEWYEEARQDRDFMALTSIDNSETKAIRLHAELTGRLQQNPQVAIQVVIGNSEVPEKTSIDLSGDDDEVIDMGPKLR